MTNLAKKQQKLAKCIQKGNFKDAIKLLQPVCRSQPDNIRNWLTLASLYGQDAQYDNVIRVCKKVYDRSPTLPQLNSLMGNAYSCLGNLTLAQEHFAIALEQSPDDPGLLNNLGSCLYIDNKLTEAAEVFEKVIKIQPNYANAHNNLGNIYKALNNNSLAVHHYKIALQLDPGLSKTMLNLGHMYADRLGNPEKAITYFESTLKMESNNLEAKSGIINMLRYLGRLDEALSMIKQLQSSPIDTSGFLSAEADIYERSGEYEKAFSIIETVKASSKLESDPMSIEVLLKICDKFDSCDEAIILAEKITRNTDLTPQSRVNVLFILGKLYDKRKAYGDAFRCYEMGNDLIETPFDLEVNTRNFDTLINTYTKENIAKLPRSSIDTSKPIFILGMPRSGTSLTEQILSCHPEVCGAGELNYINDIASELPTRTNSISSYPGCISNLDVSIANTLAGEYLEKLRSICGESRYVTDKMPHNFVNLGLISILFPQARIIHCTRDPRDTCLSIYFQNFGWLHSYGSKLEWLGQYYQNYERLMQHWTEGLDIPIHVVNYETMISDQEKTTRELLDFCNLPWDDACLNFHQSQRRVATASYDQVRQKLYTKSTARWEHYKDYIQPLIDALEANKRA